MWKTCGDGVWFLWLRSIDPELYAALPQMYYSTEFACSESDGEHTNRDPKNFGALGPAPWDGNVADLRGRRFPHTCYHANFGALDQTICAYVGDPEKNWERLGRLLGGTTAPQNMPLHNMGYDSEFD